MIEYIPPQYKIKFKYPRKMKKKMINDWGREYYYKLVTEDPWLTDGYMSKFFPDWYDREMRDRRYDLRKKKLNRIND